MSEISESYLALKLDRQRRGHERCDQACREFPEAERVARECGLKLLKRSATHFQLTPLISLGSWLINLYPGNQRVYFDRNRGRAPYLALPDDWDLKDAVKAAKKAIAAKDVLDREEVAAPSPLDELREIGVMLDQPPCLSDGYRRGFLEGRAFEITRANDVHPEDWQHACGCSECSSL